MEQIENERRASCDRKRRAREDENERQQMMAMMKEGWERKHQRKLGGEVAVTRAMTRAGVSTLTQVQQRENRRTTAAARQGNKFQNARTRGNKGTRICRTEPGAMLARRATNWPARASTHRNIDSIIISYILFRGHLIP